MHTRKLKTGPGSFRLLRNTVFLVAVLTALALPVLAPSQEIEARETSLRMAHLSPDAPEVDVYIDDEPIEALSALSFKTVSPYLTLPSGVRDVKVYLTGDTSEPLLEAEVDFEGESSYTLAAAGLVEDDSLAARLYEDDDAPAAGEDARLRVIHAVPDVGPATVGVEGGEDLFDLPGFSNASDYAEVPAGTHTLEVKPAGSDEVALRVPDVELLAGEVYTVFAVGQAADDSLDAILVNDSAGDSRVLLAAGRREQRDEEEPEADTTGPEAPEIGGFEAGPEPVQALPEHPAPLDSVVNGLFRLFDEVPQIEPEPVYFQPVVQYGSAEEPGTVTTTTTRETRPVRDRGQADERDNSVYRAGKQIERKPDVRPVQAARDTQPARAEILPDGVSASAGDVSANVKE